MLLGLLDRFRRDTTPQKLYASIVAQARQPGFYAELGVPDTLDGRFDMIVLHTVLVMRRLRMDGESGRALAQDLFDAFFSDMDRSLREMGVGDLVVPKRVRAMAEAFYGRAGAYEAALGSDDDHALAEVIRRNVLAKDGDAGAPNDGAERIAAYVRSLVERLSASRVVDIVAGSAWQPPPVTVGAGGGD